ncbi:unnamed protein product [Orchesella dallaii]|uniref:PHR domain-containing protein n=1 Tax=Orchesella dallaii TaxID=48710 RepID=A0ABP1S5L7_9HEXA
MAMEVKTAEIRPTQKPLDFSVVRGTKLEDKSKSYEGIQYTNSFRVNRRIQLTGFTFFIPEKEKIDDTVYCVVVKTMRGEKVVANFRRYKSKAELEQADNQRIRINPPRLIVIEPDVWYDVKFEIRGPPTRRLKLVKTRVVVYADKEKEGCGHQHPIATFDFFMGSGQLPEYHFLLC